MDPNWTTEQIALYRQLVAILFGNFPLEMPIEYAIALAKDRAIALINDPDLFPPNP